MKRALNTTINRSKSEKNDERYTYLADIENEVRHYRDEFRGMTILCNCDDPRCGNFFKYFTRNLEILGLKRVNATCYKSQDVDLFTQKSCEKAVYQIYDGDANGNREVVWDISERDRRLLNQDVRLCGSFSCNGEFLLSFNSPTNCLKKGMWSSESGGAIIHYEYNVPDDLPLDEVLTFESCVAGDMQQLAARFPRARLRIEMLCVK